jgi:hypothetical protein
MFQSLLWPGYFTGVQNVVQTTNRILHAILRSAQSFFGSVGMTTVKKTFRKIYSFAWYHVTRKITWPQE